MKKNHMICENELWIKKTKWDLKFEMYNTWNHIITSTQVVVGIASPN